MADETPRVNQDGSFYLGQPKAAEPYSSRHVRGVSSTSGGTAPPN